mmetsp:Transcript_104101/g.333779  ORF Transcript_104101/g.333779 Transcript_104101/m.333779 type:complete len:251 (-) Transcript_104101:568-1320(-)
MGPKSSRHSGARIRSCLTERIAAGGAAGALGGAAAAPSAAGAAGAGERSGAKASASAAASWASASGISQEKIRAVPAAAASVGKVTSNMSTPNSTACSTSTGEPEFRGRNRGSRKGSAEHTASNTLARECRSSVYPKPAPKTTRVMRGQRVTSTPVRNTSDPEAGDRHRRRSLARLDPQAHIAASLDAGQDMPVEGRQVLVLGFGLQDVLQPLAGPRDRAGHAAVAAGVQRDLLGRGRHKIQAHHLLQLQ